MSSKRGGRPNSSAPNIPSEGPGVLRALLAAVVGSLLVARWLVPPESAVLGETLWQVPLWLLAGLLWAWDALRRRDRRVRVGLIDGAMALLVAGHVVSAVSVVLGGGEARSAVNLLWEWVALGLTFFLVRQVALAEDERRRLVLIMLASATVVAGLGLWQHYVSFPRMVADYERLAGEQRSLLDGPPAESADEQARRQARLREVERELFQSSIPQDPAERQLFEARLRSSEPLGTFALTNTLAGLLACWFVVGLDVAVRGRIVGIGWKGLGGQCGALLVILYCLALTKSRTAWVGLACGLAAWGWRTWRGATSRRRLWPALASGAGLVALLVGVAAAGGGSDAEALSGAPRSLAFRLQYWAAAWDVVRDHPWLGAGPGNFRQHYLRHKLPEASEEILDPHNLVFDVWASGGLLGLAGLLLTAAAGLRALASCEPAEDGQTSAGREAAPAARAWGPLVIGGAAAFPAVMVVGATLGFDVEPLPLLALAWVAVVTVSGRAVLGAGGSAAGLVGGGTALLVHLLGAGGIEMPAVVQTLLVLAAAAPPSARESAAAASAGERPRLPILAGAALMLAALVLCLRTALTPVLHRTALLRDGDAALFDGRGARRAGELYAEAAERDPLSPEPIRKLADLLFSRWEARGTTDRAAFDKAVEMARLSIERDPVHPQGYRRLGRWHLRLYERSRENDDAEAAADWYAEAVRRYPNNAELRAEFADALRAAGRSDDAGREAGRALELDAINRRWGHRERILSQETVDRLRHVAEAEGAPSPRGGPD